MKNSSENFPQVSEELIHYLEVAHMAVGNDFLPDNFRALLEVIKSRNDIIAINENRNHPLWWFLPAILYSLYDQAIDFDWLEKDCRIRESVIVIPPPFVALENQLSADISSLGMKVSRRVHSFTLRMVGLLYGGFPWFESFWRICEAKQLLSKECLILSVEAEDLDVPTALELFKRRRRNSYGHSLQLACEDLAYPGVVRPFHSPSRMETTRHRYAAGIH